MKRYEKYKPSGVEWIGEVPEEWEVCRLKFYANIIMGQSPDGKDITDDGETPFMQGNAEFTEKYPSPIYYCETCNKHSRIGDVLMSVRAPVGELNLSDKIYGIGRGLCSIKAEQELSTSFLWYYLLKSKKDFNSFANGSTFTAITVDDLKNFPLILPPLPEQNAIATYLDKKCAKIDNVVALQQKRIELLKELKQSIITHAVTRGLDKNAKFKPSGVEWIGEMPEEWEVCRLKFYANIIMGQSPDGKDITDDGETPFMQGNAEFTEKYPNPIYYCETCNKHSRIGDVLMSVRAPVGELNLSDKIYGIGRGLCSIKAEQELSTSFLWYYLLKSKKDFNSFANGSTFTAITVDDLKNFPLILPPLPEQTAIATYLDKKCAIIDNQIAKVERQIELLKEYKQSVITECVTGKRKVC